MPLIIKHLHLRAGEIRRAICFLYAIHDAAVTARRHLPFTFKFKIRVHALGHKIPRLASLSPRKRLERTVLHLPRLFGKSFLAVAAQVRHLFAVEEHRPFLLGLNREGQHAQQGAREKCINQFHCKSFDQVCPYCMTGIFMSLPWRRYWRMASICFLASPSSTSTSTLRASSSK